ncbi:uncharacterized protein FA14DRAFT_162530 [Meira miltonrushii]|uniref:Uncharacterized protein n=1 Tax=Meira miltonrushii TaxID=1280837 RepID=A0A316V3E4_9BASI|nr:uncharacterized protein FA14DRAFT_162530 [Meira miltonrushii]PWN31508.1 hypothetical protein FA14DRAFT_162530 [Meira miltonrushii]
MSYWYLIKPATRSSHSLFVFVRKWMNCTSCRSDFSKRQLAYGYLPCFHPLLLVGQDHAPNHCATRLMRKFIGAKRYAKRYEKMSDEAILRTFFLLALEKSIKCQI